MSLVIQTLAWDSEFFNFPVALIECNGTTELILGQAVIECSAAGIKLVYLFVHPDDTKSTLAAQLVGAKLVDRKVTYSMPLVLDAPTLAPISSIVPATKFTPQLESLAWQSGEYSRFQIDSRFPDTIFKRLYSQWLRNSLNGTIADVVLAFQQNKKEVGLLTMGEKNGRADIGILAVDKVARGQRIGQQLVHEAQRIAKSENYVELQVVTQQSNIVACNFYEKCGFKLVQEEHVYHLWLS